MSQFEIWQVKALFQLYCFLFEVYFELTSLTSDVTELVQFKANNYLLPLKKQIVFPCDVHYS